MNGAGIPAGLARERSGDKPDGLAASAGVVRLALAVAGVRDNCKRSDGQELA